MTISQAPAVKRWFGILSPIDRLSEIIFGTIMALTFTGTLSIATAGREDVREMLIGAIGCNTAWGIVDGVMFIIAGLLMRKREAATPAESAAVGVTAYDLKGALGCFLLVFVSTFPIALPFFFMQEAHLALRISNGIALVMLFVSGYLLGKWAGFRPIRSGVVMMLLGLILTLSTIALGG
jgi:VIT1/CCC1 family predicted Fe2+/Mn2+ transporter